MGRVSKQVGNPAKEEEPSCPECGQNELVQAQISVWLGTRLSKGARCLVCGHRFMVEAGVFASLREPEQGEPWETRQDLHQYMLSRRMTGVQSVCCIVGVGLGILVGGYLAIRFDQLLLAFLFFPIVYAAWWFGWWIHPARRAIPGKCPNCEYDLRGARHDRCPECGTEIEAFTERGS